MGGVRGLTQKEREIGKGEYGKQHGNKDIVYPLVVHSLYVNGTDKYTDNKARNGGNMYN